MIPTAQALTAIAARLAQAGIEEPRREARLLLAAAEGITAARLLLQAEVTPERFEPLVARRAAREPLAYILSRKEFWGLNFAVSPATLIPRPDTETLVEAVLALGIAPARVLDLGTGTGCLLLALLSEFPAAFGVGVDISPAAAALAADNARSLGLASRAAFCAGNWAAALSGMFDLVVSNPPYIPSADIAGLMPEVAGFEPASALHGGADGLEAYRLLIAALPRLLTMNGAAVLELGVGQAPDVAALAAQAGFAATTRADLGGVPRALILTWRK
ncbi:peptide chain release factor N(5)-glutamine methyltransferase [Acidocella sp.]|uniref:peptide chain release factor N(5)-glutamine methyltransferase n=1 Tax=Acidocella sp. TaxID=50710 RepID=UPI00262DF596|nr:peptide chain release factor N(5)-glutamine methyltransferase [Acidocella sp.]MDD2795938.1 peptide chain release factor N(5)-glutamine methyltransferase [Acidocella sp.]